MSKQNTAPATEKSASEPELQMICLSFKYRPRTEWIYQKGHFRIGNKVIALTKRGREIATIVAIASSSDHNTKASEYIYRFERLAGDGDLEREKRNRSKEIRARDICIERIARHNLPMKLVRTHYLFDGGKILFFFRAAGKVDFRTLVKDLARTFRTRIELRQVGVRDEAGILGGLGICGQSVCCSRFLPSFDSITIRKAKNQQLSLNPVKISGLCGRLMCCLRYESDHYAEKAFQMPTLGSRLEVDGEICRITSCNYISERIVLEFEDLKRMVLSKTELEEGIVSGRFKPVKLKGKWKKHICQMHPGCMKQPVEVIEEESDDDQETDDMLQGLEEGSLLNVDDENADIFVMESDTAESEDNGCQRETTDSDTSKNRKYEDSPSSAQGKRRRGRGNRENRQRHRSNSSGSNKTRNTSSRPSSRRKQRR